LGAFFKVLFSRLPAFLLPPATRISRISLYYVSPWAFFLLRRRINFLFLSLFLVLVRITILYAFRKTQVTLLLPPLPNCTVERDRIHVYCESFPFSVFNFLPFSVVSVFPFLFLPPFNSDCSSLWDLAVFFYRAFALLFFHFRIGAGFEALPSLPPRKWPFPFRFDRCLFFPYVFRMVQSSSLGGSK